MTKKHTSSKPTKKKNTGGRPTKFNKEIKRQCELLAKAGWTDSQIAELIGVTEQTLNNWKIKHAKFFESLKDWKAEADRNVEKSLYQRACGYSFPSMTIQKEIDGKEITEIRTKHQPPDPTSIIFWLKNRQPDKWRDKKEHGFTDGDGKDLKWTVEIVDPK